MDSFWILLGKYPCYFLHISFSPFVPSVYLICGYIDHILSFLQEMDARQRKGSAGSPSTSVSPQSDNNFANRGYGVKSYGCPRRGVRGGFVPPIKSSGNNVGNVTSRIAGKSDDSLDDSTKRW